MIEDIKSDVFEANCDALIHQCNCFHTMGSGVAFYVREFFPEAYAADCQTKCGDPAKLGSFSFAKVTNPKFPNIKSIINLYSQFDFSSESRCTRYDALVDGLTSVRDRMRSKANGELRTLALPFRMGSNRGGGDWRIVRACIESVFSDEPDFKVLICENPLLTEVLQNTKSK
jgi:O-acetyl-ADP-ribose deacetylase (regulator of RNase III)